jgi:hypothetical protein
MSSVTRPSKHVGQKRFCSIGGALRVCVPQECIVPEAQRQGAIGQPDFFTHSFPHATGQSGYT